MLPTRVRLQHADGHAGETWLEDVTVDRILFNDKWFRATDDDPEDATSTYKEEPTSKGDAQRLRGTIKPRPG